MATGTITNQVTDPSGTALASVTINARLKPGPGFRSSTYYEVAKLKSTTTDTSGNWSLTLEINTNIVPANSYYEIEEKIPESLGGPQVYAVQVASGTSTLYASLISTPPANATIAYLTQSSGDARYLPYAALTLGSIAAVGTATQTGTATTAASSNHVHPLSPAVVGAGLAIASGVVNAVGSGFVTVSTTTMVVTSGYRVPAVNQNTPTVPTPVQGDLWYKTNTASNSVGLYANQAGATNTWTPPWNMPWGILGYAAQTTAQTGISTIADLTGLTVTITPVVGRRYKILTQVRVAQISSDGVPEVYIRNGSAVILNRSSIGLIAGTTSNHEVFAVSTSTQTTYKVSLSTTAGTTDTQTSGTQPGQLLVEDIGPNVNPV